MRVVFFGSADFAVPSLTALGESGHEVVGAVTQPDRHAGRGGRVRMTAVKRKALALGVPVLQPETPREEQAELFLRERRADVAAVVAYGHLIPKKLLEVPPHGFVNVHASVLPKYRGAAPVPHAILHGESVTGVTVFRLNERFDAGDVLGIEEIPIEPKDTSATVLEKLSPLGARLLLKVIGEMEAGWVQPVAQREEEATKAPKLRKEDGRIDWASSAAQIDRMVRAYQPWPLAHAFLDSGKGPLRISLLDVDVLKPPREPKSPGEILHADGKTGLTVQCGEGALKLLQLKPEGKRAMTGAEYVRGARLEAGMKLT